jgi:uncharacterized membrane protein
MKMNCMFVAIFDKVDETQEQARLLRGLCAAGLIDIYSLAVITKDNRGLVTVKQGGDYGCVGALVGIIFGSLIGLLGGLIGSAAGAVAGALVGWWVDLTAIGVAAEIANSVASSLSPGQSAVVTEMDDESQRLDAHLV